MDAVLVRVIGEIIAKLCFELHELRFHLRIKCSSVCVPTLFVETTTSFFYTYLYGNLYSGMCVCGIACTHALARSLTCVNYNCLAWRKNHALLHALGPLTVGTVRGAVRVSVCMCNFRRR